MSNPLVSVIIPTYKRDPDTVLRSVKSVLNQTYENIEVIVVDDSPSDFVHRDEVRSVLEDLRDSRLIYIRHDRNMGANQARNTGIMRSTGEYVAFLDDDDEWMPEKLECLIPLFTDGVGLVYSGSYSVSGDTVKLRDMSLARSGYVFDALMEYNFIGSTSFAIIKKECFEKCGTFLTGLASNQDWELYLRIARSYKVEFTPKPLVRYYKHESERISTNPQKKLQGYGAMLDIYKDYLSRHPRTKCIWLIDMVPHYLRGGMRSKGLATTIYAFLLSPITCVKCIIKKIKGKLREKVV